MVTGKWLYAVGNVEVKDKIISLYLACVWGYDSSKPRIEQSSWFSESQALEKLYSLCLCKYLSR